MTYWWICGGKTYDGGHKGDHDSDDNAYDGNTDHLIGLWEFADGATTKDTGLSDGVAQNGAMFNGATAKSGALKLDGYNDRFDVKGDDNPFDLDSGTIQVEFNQDSEYYRGTETLVSRGEYCDKSSEGYFGINVTSSGQVQAVHYANGKSVALSTAKGFFNPGDDVRVSYTWDAAGVGSFIVENVTDGTTYSTEFNSTGLDLDIGDNDDENFTFGARESDDGCYDQHFNGEINYVAVFDNDVHAEADGVVEGTAGDDLIDIAYTGDPDGDMIDNNDALLDGESGDDDIVDAGAGDDTVLAGAGNDEVYGGAGNDTLSGGAGDDVLYGDSTYGDGGVTITIDAGTAGYVNKVYAYTIDPDTGAISNIVLLSDNAKTAEGTSYSYDAAAGATVGVGIVSPEGTFLSSGYGSNVGLNSDKLVHTKLLATNADGSVTLGFEDLNCLGDKDFNDVVITVDLGTSGATLDNAHVDYTSSTTPTGGGDDILIGGLGADEMHGEAGDDTFVLEDSFGNDTIIGGETGETAGDTLDATAVTQDTTVVLSDDPETGTISNGSDTASFSEIENVLLGSGDDTVTGGAGDDTVDLGEGADYADLGAGDDTVSLGRDSDGTPDGDADVIKFSDNDGNDTLLDFDAPIDNGDGTFTGIDTLDVSELHDATGIPVTTNTVVVSADTDGNAVLTFPNGETLTFPGLTVAQLDSPEALNAIGIPLYEDPLDGIVEGTAGDDLIDTAYTGDPEGDMVDANDAILGNVGSNDDIIEAYEGDDTVYAGLGDDHIDGGAGDDTLYGEAGNDTIVDASGSDTADGGAGDDFIDVAGGDSPDTIAQLLALSDPNGLADLDYSPYSSVIPVDDDPNDDKDTVYGGEGNDTIITGDDADYIEGGAGNDTIYSGIDDDTVYGGDGDDYIEDVQGADHIEGGDGNDTIIAGFDTFSDYVGDDPRIPTGAYPFASDQNTTDGMDYVDGGAGNDIIYTGDDADTIYGGTGDDYIDAGIDDDFVDGGAGNDTIMGGHGSDLIYGGDGDDYIDASDKDGVMNHTDESDDTDPLPNNDRDEVHGGAGNDTIIGGDDADTLYGDDGDDTIDGGIDNDTIYGGAGRDLLIGGDGDDYIDGGSDSDTIYGGAGNDTLIGGAQADFIDGGDGDDVISSGDGKDTLLGGAGNDTIFGGNGEDYIDGGEGDDTIEGSSGNDEIYGGTGNDVINAGLGADYVDGGEGDDIILGGNENDVILGGAGNDVIDGGKDDDVIDGGDGDDTITGGDGIDTLSGGFGDDTFLGGNPGDHVDGGEDPDDGDTDTLDLTGAGNIKIVYDSSNPENGTVEFRSDNGDVTGTMTFENIENVIPCFTPGTLIATPRGEVPVESIREGDRIITRDNGIQEVRWAGKKDMDWKQFALNPHLRPVLIRKGALGNGVPERDMMVSPNHRMLVANDKTALYFEEHEILAASKHLVNNAGIQTVEVMQTSYIHFMFDRHEVVLSDGTWSESFQPGDLTLGGIGNAQREEIFELFPELREKTGINAYQSARRTLKKHEARLLVD
ncbi:Bifunctional hemolysin/adenylate cyclase precursor [Aquimixticola soesokkakensis]|uniref:Bifunctional hemolysin/adenylate cyclase n=1 Tax=Aquimixticola soesokkakensis TaxID=1519096 RepID=A0A1Y5SGL8_9RHOB|nr:Hint domain-containing protein [Aquimixticola soesokkakensis]SLN40364.1 Bifunctional hemolysin/adenylate cyclase precursor [Aquimixticola soesokkakensis]